ARRDVDQVGRQSNETVACEAWFSVRLDCIHIHADWPAALLPVLDQSRGHALSVEPRKVCIGGPATPARSSRAMDGRRCPDAIRTPSEGTCTSRSRSLGKRSPTLGAGRSN